MRLFKLIMSVTFLTFCCCGAVAQHARVAAAKNYKIEFENDLVRIVRVNYAPHEKSPMHEHQGSAVVIVVLKGGGRMNYINGDGTTSEEKEEQADSVRFVPAREPFKHASENVTDRPIETIRIELKTGPHSKPCGAQ